MLNSLSGKHQTTVLTMCLLTNELSFHRYLWHTHFASSIHTAVQMNCESVSEVLNCRTWHQNGLSRGLESKLILTNESTSNITKLIRIDQSQI